MERNTTSTVPAVQLTGILAAMLPVTDLARSAAWYRDLLGMRYTREFVNPEGMVTGCALTDPDNRFMISFRLRESTAGRADLRGEHPLIVGVVDRAALLLFHERAVALGYQALSGEHSDAAWVELVDPDGIALRVACPNNPKAEFSGVQLHDEAAVTLFATPQLVLPPVRSPR